MSKSPRFPIRGMIIWLAAAAVTAVCVALFRIKIMPWFDGGVEFSAAGLRAYLDLIPGLGHLVPDGDATYAVIHPEAAVLLAFLPLLIPPAVTSLANFPKIQRVLSGVLFACMLVTITAALSDIRKVDEYSKVDVIYLVDVSNSVTDGMLEFAKDEINSALSARDKNTTIRVVTYDSSPSVMAIPSDGRMPSIPRHAEGGNGTDIQAALHLSTALFRADAQKRIVLAGDGNQTAGDLLAEAARAGEMGIRIDTIRPPTEGTDEVLVKSIEVRERDSLRVGKPFDVTVEILSTRDMGVGVELLKNDLPDGDASRKHVDIVKGSNYITLATSADEPGRLKLTARLTGVGEDHDRFAENNETSDTFEIQGKPKVLYIERDPSSAGYLKRALEGSGAKYFDVEVRTAGGLPTSMAEYSKYAAVILGDVPKEDQSGFSVITTESMELLGSYVRSGGGFIAIGGEHLPSYGHTTIEKLLPVEFKNEAAKNRGSSAIALLIDKSGSMRQNGALDIAKEAAKSSVAALNPQDRVIVIGFDDAPYLVVPATRAVNRYGINDKISRMLPDGGTNIRDALELAYLELSLTSAAQKHVILLTDGRSSYTGIDRLVREMAGAKITVSTVAMANADTTLLGRIANLGKGKSYIARSPSSVPRIFVEETERVTNRQISEGMFTPKVAQNHEMVRGVSMQPLLGYVPSRAKPGSSTILTTPTGDPVLSHWRSGSGKTTVFTSDAKNRWATYWIRQSANFAKFWSQVVRTTMRIEESERFEVVVTNDDDMLRVSIDAVDESGSFLNGLSIRASVTEPDGNSRDIVLQQTAPGFYESVLKTSQYGPYEVRAELRTADGRPVGTASGTHTIPYSTELAAFEPDFDLLDSAARITGGVTGASFAESSAPGDAKLRTLTPIFPKILWAALALLLANVVLLQVRFAGRR